MTRFFETHPFWARLIFAVMLLLAASCAHSQTYVRWDLGAPGSAGATTVQGAGLPFLVAIPGIQLNWCFHPAVTSGPNTPCTNFAPTYTALTGGIACPSNKQIVLQGSNTCVSSGDNFGDIGLYTTTNTTCTVTCYDYTLTYNGQSIGPYVVTLGGGGGGGGGGGTVNSGTAPNAAYYLSANVVASNSALSFPGAGIVAVQNGVTIGGGSTACGSASNCQAVATSTGSVTPTSGQNTLRFVGSNYLASINGAAEAPLGSGAGFTNPENIAVPVVPLAFPGGGTSSFGIGPDGTLDLAPNGSAYYDALLSGANIGFTSDFNWTLSPTSPTSLTAGSPATITLSKCPRGFDPMFISPNSDTLTSDLFVDIGGTGTQEYVPVIATTCLLTSNGASGTITVTPVNSHSAGYNISSANYGTQEAINWMETFTGVDRYAAILLSGPVVQNWDAPVETHGNHILIDGRNSVTVFQTHRQQGIILGDHLAGANNWFYNQVRNFAIAPDYAGTTPQRNMIQTITATSPPAPCTITITYTAAHDFKVGDFFFNAGFLNNNGFAGTGFQVSAVPAANQIQYIVQACGTITGTIYAGGYSMVDYVAIQDNLDNGGTLDTVYFNNYAFSLNNAYLRLIENTSDESFVINAIGNSTNAIRVSDGYFYGAVIEEPGPSSTFFQNGAGIINLSNSNLFCANSDCIHNFSGNDLNISDTVIENWIRVAILTSRRRGGFGNTNLTNVHLESGGCFSFFGSALNCGGIVDTGQGLSISGGQLALGQIMPQFGTNGAANTYWVYYIIPVNSTSDTLCSTQTGDQRCVSPVGGSQTNLGNGPLLPIGFALADSGSGGTFTITFPPVREATSYTLLRTTATAPYTMPYGTGNFLIQSAINPLTACTDALCTVTDSVGLTPSSFTVPAYGGSSWCPFVDYWPVALYISGCGGDVQASNSVFENSYNGPFSQYITTNSPGTTAINFTTTATYNFGVIGSAINGAGQFQTFFAHMPGSAPLTSTTTTGFAQWIPAKPSIVTPTGDSVTNVKGIINSEYSTNLGLKGYPFDIWTLEDCNLFKTLSTFGNRPSNDTCDVAIGLDAQGGLSLRAQTQIDFFIATLNNPSLRAMRLDSAGLHLGGLLGTLFLDHLNSSGTAPTCTFTSGGGTSPSCTVSTGSSDGMGTIIATTGSGSPAGTGTITLTFATAMGTHSSTCLYMANDGGAASWAALAVMKDKTPSTTTDLFTWTNQPSATGANTIAVPTPLSTSTAYWINYMCGAQ